MPRRPAARTAAIRKAFIERETQAYLAHYQDVYKEVRSYCKEHGIALALKYPGDGKAKSLMESLDPNSVDRRDRNEILRRINQTVLYAKDAEKNSSLDITDAIIARLRARHGTN